MEKNRTDIDVLRRALDELLFVSAKDHSDADDINSVTAGLLRIIRRHGQVAPHDASAPLATSQTTDAEQESGKHFKYSTMSISEVAADVLSGKAGKEAMTLKEIIAEAERGGYQFDGANPIQSARAAMVRRSNSVGDLVQVSRSHWGLRAWYTQKEMTAIRHKEITKAGMDASFARKGKRPGKGWKLNAAQAAEFKRLVSEGASNSHLGKVFGLATGTASNYKTKLKSWNIGDPYPPQNPADSDDDNPPQMRLIK